MNPVVRRVLGYAGAMLVMLLLWQGASTILGSPALPGPFAALAVFFGRFGEIAPYLLTSAYRVVVSMLIGLAVGAPLGLVLGRSPGADALFGPLIFLNYPIPKVVFLPVLLVMLGIGNASIIALISVIVFFQILVTARDASRSIPEASVLSVRSLGADRAQVFRHVVVPAAMPEIFTALRISAGTAVAVLFFSENIAGSTGLGYYVFDAWSRIQYDDMFAGILAMALLGVILYELIELAEARVCRWARAGK
ncbi:MAG: ABC transporter permease [Coriobacteriia bacterium]|nr:ABC transporter permease [Coriobacteriia bacterium]